MRLKKLGLFCGVFLFFVSGASMASHFTRGDNTVPHVASGAFHGFSEQVLGKVLRQSRVMMLTSISFFDGEFNLKNPLLGGFRSRADAAKRGLPSQRSPKKPLPPRAYKVAKQDRPSHQNHDDDVVDEYYEAEDQPSLPTNADFKEAARKGSKVGFSQLEMNIFQLLTSVDKTDRKVGKEYLKRVLRHVLPWAPRVKGVREFLGPKINEFAEDMEGFSEENFFRDFNWFVRGLLRDGRFFGKGDHRPQSHSRERRGYINEEYIPAGD